MLSSPVIATGTPAPGWAGLSARPCPRTGLLPALRMRPVVGTTVRTAPAVAAGGAPELRTTDQFDSPFGVLSSRRPLS